MTQEYVYGKKHVNNVHIYKVCLLIFITLGTNYQMSTIQLGALDRIVSDMTFAPDCPIPFPCKL